MRALTNYEQHSTIGGDREARLAKQAFKCVEQGSARACRRAARILERMQ